MLEKVLHHLHNYFIQETVSGTFQIREGGIDTPFLSEKRYFMISGSAWNDGVHLAPASDLTDETFTGEISLLSIPKELLRLVEEIKGWVEKNGGGGAYLSEAFGGYSHARYSYTRAKNPVTGLSAGWEEAFRGELNRWRKM